MSVYAAAHNRLIDYAIIAELRGNADAARSLRFAARLLAMLINAEGDAPEGSIHEGQ